MNVTVPEGFTLQFFFRVLDIEEHGNCAYDYVQVREGTCKLINTPFYISSVSTFVTLLLPLADAEY